MNNFTVNLHITNANKFAHDPQKIIECYIEMQKKHKECLLERIEDVSSTSRNDGRDVKRYVLGWQVDL